MPHERGVGTEFRSSIRSVDPTLQARRLEAILASFRQQVGFGAESVRERAGARGLFRAGETEEAIVREVLAPAEAGVAAAITQSELGFEQLALQRESIAAGLDVQVFGIQAQIEAAQRQAEAAETAGLFGGIGSIVGAGLGFLAGGPPGAAAGAQIGGSV